MSKAISIRLDDQVLDDCKAWAKNEGITLTDMILVGLLEQLHGKNKPCQPMPEPEIVVPAASCEVKKPVKTPYKAPEAGKPLANGYIPKSAQELRAAHKLTHPLDICPGCSQFNQGCQCGATVYVPDPVRPAKQPKVSASKAIQPIVKAMLSGIVKQPTASHHPCCNCGVCKPLSDKLSRL